MRLADTLGVDRETAVQTYYASLLAHAGCTTDTHVHAQVFGSSSDGELSTPLMYGSLARGHHRSAFDRYRIPGVSGSTRAAQVARRLPRMITGSRPALTANCEVAGMLAGQTGAPGSVAVMLDYLLERWDGKGPLRRASGEGIPLPMRIVHVAVDAAFQWHLGGARFAASLVGERSGHAFGPDVGRCLTQRSGEILAFEPATSAWDEVLDVEPGPPLMLDGDELNRALAATGRFADLVSPYLSGHSSGVAELAAAAAERCGIEASGVQTLLRAGLVHDLGRVAVDTRIWEKRGPLTADEWEQVRLHPYHTERVLSRAPFLASLAPVATAHHEHLDRSGYHRGSPAGELTMPARLLAAADTFHTMCEPRPHRDPLVPDQAAEALAAEANRGHLDPEAVTAVVEAAGRSAPRLKRTGRTHRARGAGRDAPRTRLHDQAGGTRTRNLQQDRRPPHPERVRQDRRLEPCSSDPVRHGARPRGMGRTPD